MENAVATVYCLDSRARAYLILAAFAAFICWWFRLYFTSSFIPSVDLPGHVVQPMQPVGRALRTLDCVSEVDLGIGEIAALELHA